MSEKPSCEHLEQRIRELENSILAFKKQLSSRQEGERSDRFLLEWVSDMIWTLDLDLKTTYVSPSIKSVLGFTPEERMHKEAVELMTPESYASAVDTLASELDAERVGTADPHRSLTIEIEYYHKDGHTVWTENMLQGMRDQDGNLIGICGVSRDITERKKAKEALEESRRVRSRPTKNLTVFGKTGWRVIMFIAVQRTRPRSRTRKNGCSVYACVYRFAGHVNAVLDKHHFLRHSLFANHE